MSKTLLQDGNMCRSPFHSIPLCTFYIHMHIYSHNIIHDSLMQDTPLFRASGMHIILFISHGVLLSMDLNMSYNEKRISDECFTC